MHAEKSTSHGFRPRVIVLARIRAFHLRVTREVPRNLERHDKRFKEAVTARSDAIPHDTGLGG